MKLNASFFLNVTEFSADYRRIFIHVLKEAFKGTEFEPLVLNEKRISKPYTFSVGFSKIKKVSSEKIIFKNPVYFDFSTPLHTMIAHLYNYIFSLNKRDIADLKITQLSLFLPPPRGITSSTVTFKTVGHMVLPKKEDKDMDFEESVKFSLLAKLKVLHEMFPSFVRISEDEINLLRILSHKLESSRVRHYGGFIATCRGYITISAPPSVLNFILETGLGIRTGQGFGMVKVVREWEK